MEINLLFYIGVMISIEVLINISAIGAYGSYNNAVIAGGCTVTELTCVGVVVRFFISLILKLLVTVFTLYYNRVIIGSGTCCCISYYIVLCVEYRVTGIALVHIRIMSVTILVIIFITAIMREAIVIQVSFLTARTGVKLYIAPAIVITVFLNKVSFMTFVFIGGCIITILTNSANGYTVLAVTAFNCKLVEVFIRMLYFSRIKRSLVINNNVFTYFEIICTVGLYVTLLILYGILVESI